MKTTTLVILILSWFCFSHAIAQLSLPNQKAGAYTWKKNRFENDSVSKPKNPFLAEWNYGARWALFTTMGTAAVITGIFLLARSNEGAFYTSIPVGMISIIALPFLVSHGVNKIGRLYYPDGKAWMAFVGGLAGTAALIEMEILLVGSGRNFLMVFPIYALGAFAIIPVASALTYNSFGQRNKSMTTGSLLNIQNGSFKIGTPVPVVYPNPLMEGKICSQISLLKITL